MKLDSLLTALLLLSAVVNVAWGVFALATPQRAGEILHLTPTSGRGLSELRAVYGGAVGALGLLTAIALRRPDGDTWLLLMGLAFLGLAAGRAVSLGCDPDKGYSALVLALELGFAALLIVASSRPLFPAG